MIIGLKEIIIAGLVCGLVLVLKDLLKNLIIGLFILLHPSICIGDRIEIDGLKGKIKAIGIRWTQLEVENGTIILVQNEMLFNKVIRKHPSGQTKKG